MVAGAGACAWLGGAQGRAQQAGAQRTRLARTRPHRRASAVSVTTKLSKPKKHRVRTMRFMARPLLHEGVKALDCASSRLTEGRICPALFYLFRPAPQRNVFLLAALWPFCRSLANLPVLDGWGRGMAIAVEPDLTRVGPLAKFPPSRLPFLFVGARTDRPQCWGAPAPRPRRTAHRWERNGHEAATRDERSGSVS